MFVVWSQSQSQSQTDENLKNPASKRLGMVMEGGRTNGRDCQKSNGPPALWFKNYILSLDSESSLLCFSLLSLFNLYDKKTSEKLWSQTIPVVSKKFSKHRFAQYPPKDGPHRPHIKPYVVATTTNIP